MTYTNTFDNLGRITKKSAPDGSEKIFTNDSKNNLTSEKDERGNTVTYEYDINGRRTKKTYPNGAFESYKYDYGGRMIENVEISGAKTRLVYDALGRNIAKIDALGNQIEMQYDAVGNLILKKEAKGNVTQYEYDALGRVTKTIDSLLNVSETEYSINTLLLGNEEVTNKRGNYVEQTDKLGKVERIEFDSLGREIRHIDKRGNITTTIYSLDGLLKEVTYPDHINCTICLEHTCENGQTICEECESHACTSKRVTTSFDSLGREITFTNRNGDSLSNTYDEFGNVISRSDFNGNIYVYTYNYRGQILTERAVEKVVVNEEIIDVVREKSYTYDSVGNLLTKTDEKGLTVTFEYNNMNKVISEKNNSFENAESTKTTYTYNTASQVSKEKDCLGFELTYLYDGLGRLKTITQSNGAKLTKTYDANGNVTAEADASGNQIQYEYDALNRIIAVTDKEGNVTSYEFDAEGNNTSITDAKGNLTLFEFDQSGNVVKMTCADGSVVLREYDKVGNITKIIDGKGYITQYNYDGNGNPTREIDAKGTTRTSQFDGMSNLLRTEKGNESVEYGYNRYGELTQVNVDSLITRYEYLNGLMTKEIMTDGSEFVNEYNKMGLLTKRINSDGASETFEYTTRGELKKATDRKGVISEYTFDGVGNVLTEKVANVVSAYTYDLSGNMVKAVEGQNTIQFSFNKNNAPTAIDYGGGYVVQYEYDSVGNKLKVQTLGEQILYTYNTMNELSSVTANEIETVYSYDENGNTSKIEIGESISSEFVFDAMNMPTTLTNKVGETVEVNTYAYNAIGRQTSKTENGVTTNYAYDSFGRLQSVEEGATTTSYTYNANGDRISKTKTTGETSESESYVYSASGRLQSVTKGTQTTTFGYDLNGNQTSVTKGATTDTYSYDGNNRLVASVNNGTTTSYGYYFNGLRNSKNGTKIIYDGKNVLAEITNETIGSAETKTIRFNVYGNGLLLSYVVTQEVTKTGSQNSGGELNSITEADTNVQSLNLQVQSVNKLRAPEPSIGNEPTPQTRTTYIYQYNAHGDVTKVLSEAGITLNSYKYDAFGNVTESVEVVTNRFGYSGYEYDSETNLYYLRTRYYNPETARFITEDSFSGFYTDPLSLNKYTYCHNDPITYEDHDGEFIWRALGGALVGGLISGGMELISQMASGQEIDWKSVGASTLDGAIVGAVAAATFGNATAVGLASSAGNAVKQGINKGFENIDYVEVAVTGLVGFVGAGTSKVATKAIGSISNSAISNGGKKVLGTIAGGVSEGVSDAVSQVANIVTGRQESWNWNQTATSVGMGTITGYNQTNVGSKKNSQILSKQELETNAVIGKIDDLKDGIGENEYSLLSKLPDKGSPKANWKQNAGVLRNEMQREIPIRDASFMNPKGNTGFLKAERNLLKNHGWNLLNNYWVKK